MLHVLKKMRIWKRIEDQVVNEKLPSIRQALDLKDSLLISDSNWNQIVQTFQLPKGYKLHAIRAERKRLNDAAGLTSTQGNGTYVDVKKIIVESIKRHKPANKKLVIKFAFDGCRISSVNISLYGNRNTY
jgi:hypothetical protein